MKKMLLFLFALSLSSAMMGQLTGTYTIPGDYATIKAAFQAINTEGVGGGGVTFNVAADYAEEAVDSLVLTASGRADGYIVFQKSGVGSNPVVFRDTTGFIATGTLGGQGDAVIILEGCDYVTFDGIDISSAQQGVEYGYYLRKLNVEDGCKYINIKNCNITMTQGTSIYVAGIYSSNNDATSLINSNAGIVVQGTGGRHEYVTLTGNTIRNVKVGILLRGYNHTAAPYDFIDRNFVIGAVGAGNTIQHYGGGSTASSYGIMIQNHADLTVEYNTIDNAGGGGSNATGILYGIYYVPNSNNPYGGNALINGNNFTFGTASSSLYGVYYTQNATQATITNNTMGFGNFGSTTAYLFRISTPTNNLVFSYNQTVGNVNKTGSGTFYCYYNLGSPTGGTEVISNNNFSNITLAGSSGFYGIYSGTSATQTKEIYSNIISNITSGTGTFYGINSTYGLNADIYLNQINTVTSGGTVYGIVSGGTNSVASNAYYNTIHGVTSLGNSAVIGIRAAVAPTNNIYKNNIYDLTASGTSTTAIVSGLEAYSGTDVRFYNNFVSDLKAPQSIAPDAVRGINITAGTNVSVFFNTVYLNASSSGATFGSSAISAAAAPQLELQNNILVNKSVPSGATGYTVAYRRGGAITTGNYLATSNNNDFHAGVPGANNLIFYDGTNAKQTMAEYKAFVDPRDAGSFSEDPPFMEKTTPPYNLHMQEVQTKCESGGSEISTPIAIVDDIDDQFRFPNGNYPNNPSYPASAPDVGADEFAGIPSFTCEPPVPGNTLASANNFCFGETTILSLENAIAGTGNSFQWQISPDDITFTDILGANSSTYTFQPEVTAYYRCVVTCQNGPSTGTSNSLLVHFLYDITLAEGGERCGTGSVKLTAAGTADSLAWYTAITGGAPIGYNSPFFTPDISETTTYYVAAETNSMSVLTIGSGSTTSSTYSNPFYSYYSNSHNQHLILAEELYAAGFVVGDMTSLALDITNAGTRAMIDFSLKMALTDSTNLSSFATADFTTLYTSPSFMPVVGINTMEFTTPFHWDGVSNILIEICHGNEGSTLSMTRTCRANATPFVSTKHTRITASGGASGAVICDTVTATVNTYSIRPQFFINGTIVCSSPRTPVVATVSEPPVLTVEGSATVCNDVVVTLAVTSSPAAFNEFIWSPVENLYTDAAGTVPYTGTSALTVYARTTVAGTYDFTCNAVNNTTFCANTAQVSVTVLPASPEITAVPPALCISGISTLSVSMPDGTGDAAFQWQESFDGVNYTDIAGATNLTYTTPYIGLTTYYQLIIKNSQGVTCTVPQYTLEVQNPLITGTTPGFHCGPGTVELAAVGTTGELYWYDSPTGGTPLGTGSPFTTPYLWESQTFYVSALEPGTIVESAGKLTPSGTSTSSLSNYGMVFTANEHIRLQTVDVYPTSTAGTLSLSLYNSDWGVVYGPLFFDFPAGNGTVPLTLPLDFQINAGSNYRMVLTIISGGTLRRETSGQSYPINTGSLISLTSASTNLTGSISTTTYNWFYNWRVMFGCASPLTPVLATINLAPFYELTQPQTVCNDETATIGIYNGASYFDTFTWLPVDHLFTDPACTVPYDSGTIVQTVYLKTIDHGTYEIRGYAYNTVNGCTNFDTTYVTVLPAALAIVSDPDTLCISGEALLTLDPVMDYGSAIMQWQVSDNGTTFTDIGGATNASYNTGILTATTYYKVIIKNSSYVECVTAEKSVYVDSPAITGTTPGSRCGTGTVTLGATATPGAVIKWYGSVDGGATLGTGETFITPVISETTDFYVSAGGASGTSGTFAVPEKGQNTGYSSQAGLLFNVSAPTLILEGVHIYPLGTGEGIVNISLKNSVNEIIEQVSFTCTGAPAAELVKTFVPLDWNIPAGIGYYINMTSRTGLVSSLVRDYQANIVGGPIVSNPSCSLDGVVQITSGRLGSSGTSTSYYYFYDWQVRTGCSSPRVPVTATVIPGNPVNITPSRTICSNEAHMLTVTSQLGDYDVYTWSPATYLFTDEACTQPYVLQANTPTVYFKSPVAVIETYTCLGVNTINGCNSFDESTVTAIPNPVIESIPEIICTSGTALLRLAPATGYGIATFQWQSSPDNSVFTDIPGATNPTYNTPEMTAISYYKVIIKNSLGVVCSEPTYALDVSTPVLTSTTSGSRCGPGTVELSATATGGTVKWYADPNSGISIGTGNNFTTPFITATTSYWASVAAPGSTEGNVGMLESISGTSGAGTSTYGLFFTAHAPFTLRTVNVYPNTSTTNNGTPGTVTISVINLAGTVLHQAVVNVIGYYQASNPNMQTVELNFNIEPEDNLRLVMTAKSSNISGLMFQPSSQAPYPYPYEQPGVVSITSGTYGGAIRPELYYYFYNWSVTIGCETAKTEVLANVDIPPTLLLSRSRTICINDVYAINVISPLAQFTSYTWSPVDHLFTDAACTQPYVDGASATTVYVKSPVGMSTVYTCWAYSDVSLCTNFATASITVIPATTIESQPEAICYSGYATLSLIHETGYGAATFQWQDSPDNAIFTDIPGATSQTYTTPDLTQTKYYKVLIKSELGAVCMAPLYTMTVNHPEVFTTQSGTRCGPGSVELQATAPVGNELKWYTAANGGDLVGTGSPFNTPIIGATTNYYVAASAGGGGVGSVGPTTSLIGAGGYVAYSYYLYFDVLATSMLLNGVYVYPGAAGNVTFYIANNSGTVLHSVSYPVTTGDVGNKTYIPVSFVVPNGTAYRMGYSSTSGGVSMFRNTAGANYPYIMSDIVSITGSSFSGYPEYYYYFYDWQIETGCESDRTMVTATVTPAPEISATATPSVVCALGESTLNVTSANADYTYTWMPGNLSGATQLVYPDANTQYTVTANDAITGCQNIATVDVLIVPTPTPVIITPEEATIEPGTILALTATGGTLGGEVVFGTATTTNTTTGYPAPYTNYYGGAKHQMLIRASELTAAGLYQGAPITSVTFTVTAVGSSFPGYLNFFQIDMGHTSQTVLSSSAFIGGLANVLPAATVNIAVGQVTHTLAVPFTWNGVDNLVIQTSYSNGNTGTSLYYVQMTNSNPGFISSNWYRADGVSAATILAGATPTSSGTARPNMVLGYVTPTTVVWTPFTDLYSNDLATVPYAGETLSTVWTKPFVARTYTATATATTTGCTSSNSVTVNMSEPVVPINIFVSDTIFSGQDTCFNATQVITVAGGGNTFVVQSDASVTMIAGYMIRFLPGTKIEYNGYLHGYITEYSQYCYAPTKPVVIINAIEEGETLLTSSQSAFRVYPNPTSGEFTLEVGENLGKAKVDVAIYGIHGDRIFSTSLEGQAAYKLSLSDKPAGIYFVRLVSGSTTGTLKIIKQ